MKKRVRDQDSSEELVGNRGWFEGQVPKTLGGTRRVQDAFQLVAGAVGHFEIEGGKVCIGNFNNAVEGTARVHAGADHEWPQQATPVPFDGVSTVRTSFVDIILPVLDGTWHCAALEGKHGPCGFVCWHSATLGPEAVGAAKTLAAMEATGTSVQSVECTPEAIAMGVQLIGRYCWDCFREAKVPWPSPRHEFLNKETVAYADGKLRGTHCFFVPPKTMMNDVLPALSGTGILQSGISLVGKGMGALCHFCPGGEYMFGVPIFNKDQKAYIFCFSTYDLGPDMNLRQASIGGVRIYPNREASLTQLGNYLQEQGFGITGASLKRNFTGGPDWSCDGVSEVSHDGTAVTSLSLYDIKKPVEVQWDKVPRTTQKIWFWNLKLVPRFIVPAQLPQQLRSLSLDECGLEGTFDFNAFPPLLRSVTVSGNKLTGVLPTGFFASLKQRFPYLVSLDISGNDFEGTVDVEALPPPDVLHVRAENNRLKIINAPKRTKATKNRQDDDDEAWEDMDSDDGEDDDESDEEEDEEDMEEDYGDGHRLWPQRS